MSKEEIISKTKEKSFNDEHLFKVILSCCKNYNKPDLHSFYIQILGGAAYVECGKHEVNIVCHYDAEPTEKWAGTPVAATNYLEKKGAIHETIEI